MFLQDIGVGVNVVCWWRTDEDGANPRWYLRRCDTKQEFSLWAGARKSDPHMATILILGINLGLELQGKVLNPAGYTKLDVVAPIKEVYYTTSGYFTEDPFPHRETKAHRWDLDDPRSVLMMPELLFNENPLDCQFYNFGLLFKVWQDVRYKIAAPA